MNPHLIGWCKYGNYVVDPYPGPSTRCDFCDEEHMLAKRLMYGPCGHESCAEWGSNYYFKQEEYMEHFKEWDDVTTP